MPHRCLVFVCSNATNLQEGITLLEFPMSTTDVPKQSQRRKAWIVFVKRKRTKWEQTEHSEICSKHFNECDFISRYVGDHNIRGAESKLQVRPGLK